VTSNDLQHMKSLLSYLNNPHVCIPSVPIGLSSDIDEEYVIEPLIYPHVEQIMFNNAPGTPLADLRVRRALSMYINRQSLATVYGNEVDLVDGPMPAKYPYYCKDCNIPYHQFDEEAADRLLREAGYTHTEGTWVDQEGHPLQVDLLGYVGSTGSIVAQIIDHIAEGWKKYGIVSAPQPVTPREYLQRLKAGDFDAAFHRLSYHVVPELSRYFLTGGKENYGQFSDPIVDSLWNAVFTVSAAGLQDWWYEMHRRIGEMAPGAFLWTPQDYAVYSMYIVVGQNFYPQNFIGKIEEWEIEN
jgi:ABC-type transport system substrate-binding protein